MKKLLILLAVAAVGLLVYRKVAQDRAELDLWAEVTDPVE
ncbi:MAG: DLW-39 family protein [Bifidobacteriaceae bacterium]|nr:DLW-39 family protein [Bifidobacteriaceae bacterium]